MGPARADDAEAQIAEKITAAMESFDGFEYEEAKALLHQAILIAKKQRMSKSGALARAHISLGIVYYAGLEEEESAKLAFIDAVMIDPAIEIDPAYKSAALQSLLDEVRAELGASRETAGTSAAPDPGAAVGGVDCLALEGLQHKLVDIASAGQAIPIEVQVGDALGAGRVVLHYRPKGAAKFSDVPMRQGSGCSYAASIPATALQGEFLHYYIAAYDDGGQLLASRGGAGSPNIIEIDGAELAGGLGGRDTGEDEGLSGTNRARIYLSLIAGSGGGYVTGKTEQKMHNVECCFAPALLHINPELGIWLTERTSLAAVFRGGFTIGANRDEHATFAPAGLLKVRHAFSDSGEGFHVAVGAGAGIIRHTVKLEGIPAEEGDVDTTATGPLIFDLGLGVTRTLAGPVRFIAEANALAGVPVADLGDVTPHFGVQFDANLGLLLAF